MFKYENDSRKVKEGQTFIAIKGLTVDGHNYIDKAISNGASHIISEIDLDINIPYTKVNDTSEYQREILVKEYGEIINKLKIIGVTGTNGKTTSCFLIYQMLRNLGINAAYIGTIGFYHNDKFIELNNTTPDILVLYQLLYSAYNDGCEVVVMEVSSQALSYNRLHGINFDIIGFTNFTEDHLDYHKTMENYLEAKKLILNHLDKDAIICVNKDDAYHNSFNTNKHKFITFGNDGDYKIVSYSTTPKDTDLVFEYDGTLYNVTIPLTSKFNVYNFLTMLSILNQYGFDINSLLEKTELLKNYQKIQDKENLLIKKVDKSTFYKLVMTRFLLFSVYTILVDYAEKISGLELNGLSTVGLYGSSRGYTIVNFILLYIIGEDQ